LSAKIEQIIDVVKGVREKFLADYDPDVVPPIGRWRYQTIQAIADSRGVEYQSINDKPIRKLRPDVSSLSQFDRLLREWLTDGSEELKTLLLKHASSQYDRALIEEAFWVASESDVALAQELNVDPKEESFKEGKEQLRLHLAKERNRHLIESAKSSWAQSAGGNILCEVCGFSFADAYGALGKGIEGHHRTPISEIAPDSEVRISDLAPVCSNCHSILHRRKPWPTIEQLKQAINRNAPNAAPALGG
jgi:hypothetical protein